MAEYTVVLLDASGIQRYIFNSNTLSDIVGASYLVERSLTAWPQEILAEMGISQAREPIEKNNNQAELVFAGGGNAMLLFRDDKRAREFAGQYSRRLLTTAPGLNVALCLSPFDWNAPQESLEKAYGRLASKKDSGELSRPMLGLGVTAACRATGLPAYREGTTPDGEPRLESREIAAKQDHKTHANQRLRDVLLPGDTSQQFPLDFDHLGRSAKETSYIAVVHADGNGVGKRFDNIRRTPRDARPMLDEYRRLSEAVNAAGLAALRSTVDQVRRRVEAKDGGLVLRSGGQEFDLHKDNLPIRPLIYGGDDVTLVTDGRLGLEVARLFLQDFATACGKRDQLQGTNACAGVAIVKTHYPFARAYELADSLLRNAKRFAREATPSESYPAALDWHVAFGGIYGELSEIRGRLYKTDAGRLYSRPLLLEDSPGHWRTWKNFRSNLDAFRNESRKSRNKIKDFYGALRSGSVEAFQRSLRRPLHMPAVPQIHDGNEHAKTGWHKTEKCSVYFDALEMLDLYWPLRLEEEDRGKEVTHAATA